MRKGLLSVALFALIALMAMPVLAQNTQPPVPEGADQTVVVNFELARHLIVVKTKINGSDKDYNFVVDTGAGICILDKTIVDEVGAKKTGQANVTDTSNLSNQQNQYTVQSINVGGVEFGEMPVLDMDLRGMSAVGGMKIDGIIGDSFLRFFCVQIDYKKKQLTFSLSAAKTPGKYFVKTKPQPMFQTITVPITIDKKPIEAVLDTGSSSFVVPIGYLQKLGYPASECRYLRNTTNDSVLATGKGVSKDMVMRVSSLGFGNFNLRHFILDSYGNADNSEKLDTLLGYNFLSKFKVIIDYPRNTVMLTPNDDAVFPTNTENFGITVGPNQKGELIIQSIFEGCAADKQGANVGDVITKVNDKNLTDYTPAELMKLFNDVSVKELSLTLKSNGNEFPVKIKRTPLFPEITATPKPKPNNKPAKPHK